MTRFQMLILAALPCAILMGWLMWQASTAGDPGGPSARWCVDQNTGNMFAVPMSVPSPCPAPSGDLLDAPAGTPAGVDALVLQTQDGSPRIAYLIAWRPRPGAPASAAPIRWVRLPADAADSGTWHPDGSAEARAITERAGTAFTVSYPAE